MDTVESIVDGTWGSGAPPAEWVDFCLMHKMRWTYEELRATPPYVVRYVYDFLAVIGEYEAEESEKAARDSKRQQAG